MMAWLSVYRPRFTRTIVYMLQSTEYRAGPYLSWLRRINNFNGVMNRRTLVMTRPAVLLLSVIRLGMLAQVILSLYLGHKAWQIDHSYASLLLVIVLALSTPIVWAYLIVLPLVIGRVLVMKPYWWWQVRRSARLFAAHPAAKIAIAGSYGKTTMKEILATVLAAGQKVAATPGNKNVAISHARFIKNLSGDEEILIIEYGEGAPGDVARFAKTTKPNIGIITGLAPAHLDKYKTIAAAGRDIFSLAEYLEGGEIYVNDESVETKNFMQPEFISFDSKKVAGWKISNIKTDLEGLRFSMKKGKTTLELHCRLIGKHLVGPLALAAYLGYETGMSKKQIETAVADIEPFEHRMQPYKLNGATIIDDTYNGNIEGMKAGLALLHDLPAKRKIYVTPGLVDQGAEEASVHLELGEAIAHAKPDKVVLMENSVTDYIRQGMKEYIGELTIEDDPLNFYTHLDRFVAEGDLVLMQNDWTDNYI